MSWQTASAVLIVIVATTILTTVMIDPLIQILDALANSGDYADVAGTGLDGESLITGFAGDWLNMTLILIFGIMAWGVARVVRRELTQGRV